MFLSKHPNGIYYLWYDDDNNRRHKVSTRCHLKSDALKFLQSFRRDEYKAKKQARHRLVSVFISDFIGYAEKNYSRKSFELYERTLKKFLAIAGDRPLISLTPEHFDLYKTVRQKNTRRGQGGEQIAIAPVTVNIELRTLRAWLNTALRWKLIPSNPFAGQKFVSLPQRAPVYLSQEDFRQLLAVTNADWLRELIVFAACTGMRRGEILNLRWQDVDFERGLVRIESNGTFHTKQGKRRVVPMNKVAQSVLQARRAKESSEHVFTLNGQMIVPEWASHAFKKAVRKAGLNNNLHFHSLRHTFATWLVQSGVGIYEVQKLMGHSSVAVTQVYAHLAPSELHGAVEKITLALN